MIPLPRRLLEVMTRHNIGGVEAMLVLHLVLRWPEDSFGGGSIVALDQRRSSDALGVCTAAIDAAVERLAERRLLLLELHRGRRHVRVSPLNFAVGGLWPEIGCPDAVVVPADALRRVIASASRGRDSVCLLVLLMMLPLEGSVVPATTGGLASTLGISVRAAQRIVARLVKRGFIQRVAGGIDLEPLLRPDAGAIQEPMDVRYVARVAELLSRNPPGRETSGRSSSAPELPGTEG